MANRPLPDAELLRKLLRYEPETGKLYWRERTPDMFEGSRRMPASGISACWNSQYAGREALTAKTSAGYRHGTIQGRNYTAHRVIWKMVTGVEPQIIDHINGKRDDNRFANIRCIALPDNSRNMALAKNNSSGCPGVGYVRRYNRWRARIKVDGHDKHLGHFVRLEDAVRARKAAEREYGFHPNHGRKT